MTAWLQRQVNRVVTTAYRRVFLMVHDLRPLPGVPSDPIRLTWLSSADLDAYLAFRPRANAHDIGRRFSRGDQACAAWIGDRIVHVAWMATGRGPAPYLRRDLALAEGEAMIFDSFTIDAFRRRGITRARMAFVIDELKRRGQHCCICIVAVENTSGYRTLLAHGYRPAGRYVALGVGRSGACWATSADLPALLPPRP